MSQKYQKVELRTRTKKFAAMIIRLFSKLDLRNEAIRVIGKQMLRSGTSVGANYREASRARSQQEFIAKIELCAQEAEETQYWLELLNEECGIKAPLTTPA